MTTVLPMGTPLGRSLQSRGAAFLLLIADADTERANELSAQLAEHQVGTIVCADGAEALVLAGAEHPDAVLATATLPTLDGATVVRALSARTTIPVVIGIGDGDGPAAAAALTAGAAACVAHPYRLREVLPILRAIRPDGVSEPSPPIEVGTLRLDPASLEVHLQRLAWSGCRCANCACSNC